MKNYSLVLASAALCALPWLAAAADEQEWTLKKEKDDIQIYTRAVDGSKFKAVRGVMLSDARLSSVVALIRDSAACSRWADLCKEARVLEQSSETDYLVYNLNDIPWPVKDRDAVTRVVWQHDPATGRVTMTATAIDSDLVPATGKAVRLRNAVTKWILTPQADGKLEIASEGHIDPGGPTPAWMTNLMLVDSPLKTLQNMRKEFELHDQYADRSFEFIDNP